MVGVGLVPTQTQQGGNHKGCPYRPLIYPYLYTLSSLYLPSISTLYLAMNTQDEIIPEEVQDNGTAVETAEPKEPTIEELLIAAQEEAGRNLEGWQRALADLANARKRFEKQSQMAYSNATVDLVSKLLPMIDDFDRGMASVHTSADMYQLALSRRRSPQGQLLPADSTVAWRAARVGCAG